MSAHHGQGFATWLVMLPLLVVPLIAVFGVPQFTPITAQTADGADGEEPELQFELGDNAPLAEAIPPFPSDSIATSPAPATPQPSTEGWSDPFENPTGWTPPNAPHAEPPGQPDSYAGGNSLSNPFNRPDASNSPAPPPDAWAQPEQPRADAGIEGYKRNPVRRESLNGTTSPPSIETAAQMTWREAVARLNKLGVQKFQLSQTDEPFVFQFVCDLSRPDNPRVTHRFEAKAGEPLKAVENVIQQVESWSAQQALR